MASLSFNKIINLTTHAGNPAPKYVEGLNIAQEPSGDIYQYYTVGTQAWDKQGIVQLADYDNIVFKERNMHITSKPVARIGIKSFPQLGAYGFYTRADTLRSYMLMPVHIDIDRSSAPVLEIEQTESGVTFTITPPTDITYMCYRILMTLGSTVYEYVTYEETLTVAAPYASGNYEIYCVGYVNEGQRVSMDSLRHHVDLVGSGVPDAPVSDVYVTAARFDENNLLRLTLSTGEVVVASNAPAASTTNELLTVTLAANDWVGSAAPYSQTVSVTGVALTGYAYVASPASSCWGAYCHCGIYMDEPAVVDTITFYATSDKPSTDLTVQVIKMGVISNAST